MASAYQIGDFEFLDLRGNPLPVMPSIEVRTYPGFDGGTAWHMGTPPSQPFVMFSREAVDDIAAGVERQQEYAVHVGQVLTLKYLNVEHWLGIAAAGGLPAHPPTKVLVLNVAPMGLRAIRTPINFDGDAILDAQWTLAAWPVEEEE